MFERSDFPQTIPADRELDFARRSIRYLLEHRCSAAEIIEALTEELDLTADTAHDLIRETTSVVAA